MVCVSVPGLALLCIVGVFLIKKTKKGGGNHRNALQITEHAVVVGPWTDHEKNKRNLSEIIMAFFFLNS